MGGSKGWKRIFCGMLVLFLAVSGLCVQPLEAEAVSGKITLTKTKMTLYAGESTKVTVKKVTNLKNSKVKFSSSNKKVATVSSKGLVTAKKKGTATITVTSAVNKNVKAKCRITVKSKPKKIKLTLQKNKAVINAGKSYTIKVKKATGLSSKEITCKSSNKGVAKVTAAGKITGVKAGSAVITVTSAVNKKVKVKFQVTVRKGSSEHVYADNFTTDTEPTCTKAGSKSRHCTIAGHTDKIDVTVIPAKGHSFGDWEVVKEPGYTETGLKERSCTVCHYVQTEEIPVLTGQAAGLYDPQTNKLKISWEELVTNGIISYNGVVATNWDGMENSSSDTLEGKLVISESATSLDTNAFRGCSKLSEVVIPGSINSMGEYAFTDCSGLQTVVIQQGIKKIDEKVFYRCENLMHVTIPDSVTTIGSHAFRECGNLTEITIPDSVTAIAGYVFTDCRSLTEITIPATVNTLGKGVFYDCRSLTSIVIPDGITTVREQMFHSCTSLTKVTIPDSVTSIEAQAFENCASLQSITIPSSVTEIADEIFYDCTSLTEINYEGPAAGYPWGAPELTGNIEG